ADRSMVVVLVSASDLALRTDRARAPACSRPSNRDSSEPSPDEPPEGAAAPGATATTANLLLVGRNWETQSFIRDEAAQVSEGPSTPPWQVPPEVLGRRCNGDPCLAARTV